MLSRLDCSAVQLLTLYFTQLSPLPTPTPILDQVGCLRNPIRFFFLSAETRSKWSTSRISHPRCSSHGSFPPLRAPCPNVD